MTILYKTKIISTKTEIQADDTTTVLTRLINSKVFTIVLKADISILKLKNLISLDDELFAIMSS